MGTVARTLQMCAGELEVRPSSLPWLVVTGGGGKGTTLLWKEGKGDNVTPYFNHHSQQNFIILKLHRLDDLIFCTLSTVVRVDTISSPP